MTKWILKQVVLAIHDEQLAEHGGSPGIRDDGALESVLGRPRQLEAYGEPPPDLADLAAAYAFGLARNHPFVDGNKRTSLVVAEGFLAINGRSLDASDAECVRTWLSLAAGDLTQDDLAAWLRPRIA